MLRPRVKITFTKSDNSTVTYSYLKGFETSESYENLTDTCTITLPKKDRTMNGKELFAGSNPIFKRGDKVKIECGYFPNSRTVFEGYIKSVSANVPLTIECEDGMFLLKQLTFNIPAKIPLITMSKRGEFLKRPKVDTTQIPSLTLQQLLDLIIPDDIPFTIVDNINLGKFRIVNATPAMILAKIRETHGLFSYFVGSTLYVGFASNALNTAEAEFKMEEQVINSNQLSYKQAEEVSIKVRCTSMNDLNVKTTVEVGADDGEQRDYHYYNLTETELKEIANKRLNEERYTGFFGEMETLLEPYVKHGDRAKITSKKLPERNGVYLIKGVRRLIDVEIGGRQYLQLGVKVG